MLSIHPLFQWGDPIDLFLQSKYLVLHPFELIPHGRIDNKLSGVGGSVADSLVVVINCDICAKQRRI